MRRLFLLLALFSLLSGASPDWQDQSTQSIIVRMDFYEPTTGKHRIDGQLRAYVSGADTTIAHNHFDFTPAATGQWEATEMEGGAEIRSGWYRIREIEGADSTWVDRMLIYAYGLPKYAVDSDTTIATNAVTARTIAPDAVHESEIADGSVLSPEIATDAVGDDELTSTTVTPATYGSASAVATFTVDEDGRLTNAANASIGSLSASVMTDSTWTAGQIGRAFKANSIGEAQIGTDAVGSQQLAGTLTLTGTTTTAAITASGIVTANSGLAVSSTTTLNGTITLSTASVFTGTLASGATTVDITVTGCDNNDLYPCGWVGTPGQLDWIQAYYLSSNTVRVKAGTSYGLASRTVGLVWIKIP